eukprot:PhM_4_TR16086/c0_g1_i2/m.38372
MDNDFNDDAYFESLMNEDGDGDDAMKKCTYGWTVVDSEQEKSPDNSKQPQPKQVPPSSSFMDDLIANLCAEDNSRARAEHGTVGDLIDVTMSREDDDVSRNMSYADKSCGFGDASNDDTLKTLAQRAEVATLPKRDWGHFKPRIRPAMERPVPLASVTNVRVVSTCESGKHVQQMDATYSSFRGQFTLSELQQVVVTNVVQGLGPMCVVAPGCTGKTFAAVAAVAVYASTRLPNSGPHGVIVVASQRTGELLINTVVRRAYGDNDAAVHRNCLAAFGGSDKRATIDALLASKRRGGGGPDLIVATPGRLIDLIRSKLLKLDTCAMMCIERIEEFATANSAQFSGQLRSVLGQVPPDCTVLGLARTNPALKWMKNVLDSETGSDASVSLLTRSSGAKEVLRWIDNAQCFLPNICSELREAVLTMDSSSSSTVCIFVPNAQVGRIVLTELKPIECAYLDHSVRPDEREDVLTMLSHKMCGIRVLVTTDEGCNVEGWVPQADHVFQVDVPLNQTQMMKRRYVAQLSNTVFLSSTSDVRSIVATVKRMEKEAMATTPHSECNIPSEIMKLIEPVRSQIEQSMASDKKTTRASAHVSRRSESHKGRWFRWTTSGDVNGD